MSTDHSALESSSASSSAKDTEPAQRKWHHSPNEGQNACNLGSNGGQDRRSRVIAHIESIFEQQLNAIVSGDGEMVLTPMTRSQSGSTPSRNPRRLGFPGKTVEEAWRYAVVLRILELSYEALIANTILTKRELFYRDPALFSKQEVVDRYVDDIACTFGISRLHLNIVAAAKGLVAGCVCIKKADGTVMDLNAELEGTLIPRLGHDDCIDLSPVKWILVVEKEATFSALVNSTFWRQSKTKGIIITGKGYPDIQTRSFLRSICESTRQDGHVKPTVHALMDFDPDGLDILSTYKHGSASLAHETARLKVPAIAWLGISSDDLQLSMDSHRSQALLRLSSRDRWKASHMLKREPFLSLNGQELPLRCELQRMLFLNVKAEIQALDAHVEGLSRFLAEKGLR